MALEDADALQVRSAGPDDAQPIIATLALAFAADPAMRFLLPDASSYHALAPEMIGAVVSTALEHGTLDVVERWHGAAAWFPPNVRVPEATVQELVRKAAGERLQEVIAGMAASGGFDPGDACWTLRMVGVDPLRQGHGVASRLLRHGLKKIDERAAAAYLTCSNPRTIALYERCGFEVKREAPMGAGVSVIHMVRAAK